jgi:hypothetical protein
MDTVAGESLTLTPADLLRHRNHTNLELLALALAIEGLVTMFNFSMNTCHQALTGPNFGSRVKHADYPGITPDADHEVRGMYVTGLTDANMYHLDQFEGSEYDRKTVTTRLLSRDNKGSLVEGESVECEVYVFNNPAELEDREWDYEEFRTQKMKLWTREDYGFTDSDHFSPQRVDSDDKAAAVCE